MVATKDEVEEVTKRRNVTNDPMEDKLTLFRQQAAIISRKKESTAEALGDARNDLQVCLKNSGGQKKTSVILTNKQSRFASYLNEGSFTLQAYQ